MGKVNTSLSKWTERLLRTICPEELYEEIEGDLIQQFNRNINIIGYPKFFNKTLDCRYPIFETGILFRKGYKTTNNGLDLQTGTKKDRQQQGEAKKCWVR